MPTDSTDPTDTPDTPQAGGLRSLAEAAEYVEGTPELPEIKIPCFGCGRRGVLKYPYAEDADTMWCTICGTMHNQDDDGKIMASVPVLAASIMEIFGSKPAVELIRDHHAKQKADAAAATAADGG